MVCSRVRRGAAFAGMSAVVASVGGLQVATNAKAARSFAVRAMVDRIGEGAKGHPVFFGKRNTPTSSHPKHSLDQFRSFRGRRRGGKKVEARLHPSREVMGLIEIRHRHDVTSSRSAHSTLRKWEQ